MGVTVVYNTGNRTEHPHCSSLLTECGPLPMEAPKLTASRRQGDQTPRSNAFIPSMIGCYAHENTQVTSYFTQCAGGGRSGRVL